MKQPAEDARIHELKTLPKYFREVLNGKKRAEFRRFDRDFRVGDRLFLREYDPESGYTGRELVKKVRYIFRPNEAQEFCVLELEP